MRLIIDADPIVYRSGFAAQRTDLYALTDCDDTGPVEHLFQSDEKKGSTRQQLEAWEFTHPDCAVLTTTPIVSAEQVSHALQIVDNTLRSILNEGDVAVRAYTILLSGPNNYRIKIATLKPYKGNRDPTHVPVHYQAIRDHLTGPWGARVIHNREADDECSILAWQARRDGKPYAVATIDKDLDQIPGTHYDYRLKQWYEVSESEAERWLWVQIVAGDSGDNIGGVPGYGKVKAEKFIDSLDKYSKTERWTAVVELYRKHASKIHSPYMPDQAESAALENARLVYLQQRPGELWNPPGVPFGTIGEDLDD